MRPAVVTSHFKRLRLVLRASISMMAFKFMRPEDASRFSRFFDLLRNDALRGASGTIHIALGCSMYSQFAWARQVEGRRCGSGLGHELVLFVIRLSPESLPSSASLFCDHVPSTRIHSIISISALCRLLYM